jgi:two-component system, NarL family, nitrate/nitrite response regulator NarL
MSAHRLDDRADGQQAVSCQRPSPDFSAGRLRAFIVSNVRLYREGVAISLARDETLDVIGTSAAATTLLHIVELRPNVVLLDSSLIDSPVLLRRMRDILPDLKVVAFAVSDDDRDVIACAEAGISAFVSRDGSAADLVAAVHHAMRGELVCSPRVAALLFGHLATLSCERAPPLFVETLTHREREIVPLLEQGLSNKEIARQLHVGAATVKNHIHNILEKLRVRRRGEVAARIRREGM